MEAPLALDDLRVLEIGSMLAGPFVGSLLADFGAEVIKVEKPGQPDALREWPPHKNGVA
ncbi:MAG: CoA transferase, partial [Geminicoccales bacterium]